MRQSVANFAPPHAHPRRDSASLESMARASNYEKASASHLFILPPKRVRGTHRTFRSGHILSATSRLWRDKANLIWTYIIIIARESGQ
jgi:hypothetical protein